MAWRTAAVSSGTALALHSFIFDTWMEKLVETRDEVECVVIGAGPAGLTAATYLARYRRNFIVFDKGESRAEWIPKSHNCPGFPEGIAGTELLQRLRRQAEHYGVQVVRAEVTDLRRANDRFEVMTSERTVRARQVLLATGIVDVQPDIENIRQLIRRGHVRLCPVCDGYEVMGKRVAVLGPLETALKKAYFLRSFTPDLTVLPTDRSPGPGAEDQERLSRLGIRCDLDPVVDVECAGEDIAVLLASGRRVEIEVLYPALGCEVRSRLAMVLGAEHDADGYLVVDAHQRTSIPGFYAAGDVVSELNQMSVAFGHAAIAATDMYNQLREQEDAEEKRARA